MIQYLMLVALGFFLACFFFVLVAPLFWGRAVRLTRRRMESTMPLTLSEIEAEKDQLRASFAVKIRRLESALRKAKEKSSHQLVEISRMQMGVTTYKDQIADLERNLDERRNAASVFEMTIKKRFPELENALSTARASLDQRAYEVGDLNTKIRRREEALTLAQRSAGLQQAEITRLRDAMEKSGAERSTRFKKRPSQWTLDEYRAEYDRLNVDLSKLREQLAGAYDREAHQTTFLKAELQQLAEQIIAAGTGTIEARAPDAASAAPTSDGQTIRPNATQPRVQPRRPGSERFNRPQPWPKTPERDAVDVVELASQTKTGARTRFETVKADDFANKSLEEVLEAALPMSGEALIVREEKSPDAKSKTASTLVSPILKEDTESKAVESVKALAPPQAITEVKPPYSAPDASRDTLPDMAIVKPDIAAAQREGLRALFDVKPARDDKPAPSDQTTAAGLAEKQPVAESPPADEIKPQAATTVTAAQPMAESAAETMAPPSAPVATSNGGSSEPTAAPVREISTGIDASRIEDASKSADPDEEREPAPVKRTLLDRLRGVDERVS